MPFSIRAATKADQDAIRRALFQAWRWRDPWSAADFQQHLALGRPDSYVDDFGHALGDAGFIAERLTPDGPQIVGAAWFRLFTQAHHHDGYVADSVPEVVVAVSEEARARGLGRNMLNRLIHHAAVDGIPALSLHVSRENVRAQNLYRSLGFAVVEDRGSRGLVMLKRVPRSADGPASA